MTSNQPGVVQSAIDLVFLDETARVVAQCSLAHAAAKAFLVPEMLVHFQKVPINDRLTTARTLVTLSLACQIKKEGRD